MNAHYKVATLVFIGSASGHDWQGNVILFRGRSTQTKLFTFLSAGSRKPKWFCDLTIVGSTPNSFHLFYCRQDLRTSRERLCWLHLWCLIAATQNSFCVTDGRHYEQSYLLSAWVFLLRYCCCDAEKRDKFKKHNLLKQPTIKNMFSAWNNLNLHLCRTV